MKYIMPLIFVLSCSAGMEQAVSKLHTAADIICDGLDTIDKYDDTVEMIQEQIEKKDYAAALVYARILFNQVQSNGDMDSVPEAQALLTILEKLSK